MLLQDNDHLSSDLGPAETHASTAAKTRRCRKQPIECEPTLIKALVAILDSLRPVLSPPARKQIARALLLGPRKRRRRDKPASRGITVGKLCKEYLDYARGYYHRTEGGSQAESTTVMYALRPLRNLRTT